MYEIKDIKNILDYFDNFELSVLEIREESTGNSLRLKGVGHNNVKRQDKDNRNNNGTNNDPANPIIEKRVRIKSEGVGFFNSLTSEGVSVKKKEIIGEIIVLKTPISIESPCNGEVKKIYPKNGDPVEYGESLMDIQKS